MGHPNESACRPSRRILLGAGGGFTLSPARSTVVSERFRCNPHAPTNRPSFSSFSWSISPPPTTHSPPRTAPRGFTLPNMALATRLSEERDGVKLHSRTHRGLRRSCRSESSVVRIVSSAPSMPSRFDSAGASTTGAQAHPQCLPILGLDHHAPPHAAQPGQTARARH